MPPLLSVCFTTTKSHLPAPLYRIAQFRKPKKKKGRISDLFGQYRTILNVR